MSIREIGPGLWHVDFGDGVVLEVIVACGISAGFWRLDGELVAEAW